MNVAVYLIYMRRLGKQIWAETNALDSFTWLTIRAKVESGYKSVNTNHYVKKPKEST